MLPTMGLKYIRQSYFTNDIVVPYKAILPSSFIHYILKVLILETVDYRRNGSLSNQSTI